MPKPESLTIEVRTMRRKLSPAAARAFAHLEEFDWIVFTSKRAAVFFTQELRERGITIPKSPKIAAVGPTTAEVLHALGYTVKAVAASATVRSLLAKIRRVDGKRLLFPRSAIASQEPIRKLEAQGARVTTLSLYDTEVIPLTKTLRTALLRGDYSQIKFKSPSGVRGLIAQFISPEELRLIQNIPAACIGPTTARAARAIGFKRIIIEAML